MKPFSRSGFSRETFIWDKRKLLRVVTRVKPLANQEGTFSETTV